METPSQDLLIANGLIHRSHHPENHEFVCSICIDDSSFEDWKQHITNELHIRTLEQFNLTFNKNGSKISCKLCNLCFDQNEFKTDGKSHKIVPWHDPEDKYETFFKNRLIGCKNGFYCCLCKINFSEWQTAFLHINDQKHHNLLKEISLQPDDFSSKLPADVTYKLLVTESFVPFNDISFECRICRCNDVKFTRILRHSRSFSHSWDKITFVPNSKEKTPKTDAKFFENFLSPQSSSKKLITENSTEEQSCKDSCDYLKKLNDQNFRCNVCDCLIFASTANIAIHTSGKLHADSLKKYGCHKIFLKEDATYHCKCCSTDIPDREKLYDHIKNMYHWIRNEFSELRFGEPDVTSKIKTSLKLKNMPESSDRTYHYIAKMNERESRCIVCDCVVAASSDDYLKHVNEENHANALKKYGCDNVSAKSQHIFYCKCCDHYIFGSESVYRHIKESKHVDNVKAQSIVSDKNSITVEATKQPEVFKAGYRPLGHYYIRKPRPPKPVEPLYTNIVKETIPSNYIKRENTGDSCCIVCNITLPTSAEIENHIISSNHKICMDRYGCDNVSLVYGNCYFCRCCNCRIFGNDNVFQHVKGRQHGIEHMAEQRAQKNSDLAEQTQNKESEMVLQSAQSEPTKATLSSILTNEITKMVEEVKSNQAAARSRFTRVRLPNLPKIIDEPTPCTVCSVVFDNSADLHTHLASHFSEDFFPKNPDKNSDRPKNDTDPKVLQSFDTVKKNPESIEPENNSCKNDDNNNNNKFKSTKSLASSCNKETFYSESDSDSDTESLNNCHTPKKVIMKNVLKQLNFDKDHIYDMKDKLREIELGMKLCLITDATRIYCLICRKTVENTLQDYFQHLCSLDHCDYLEKMENDDEVFESFPEQFSELALAYEYMEEISDDIVLCLVCHEDVPNTDYDLRDHIDESTHERIRDEMHINGKRNFENVKSRVHCDWYNVQKYWCVLCSEDFESEISFAKHLESRQHANVARESDNVGKALIYDFCAPCALLWYGYRCTYAYHCTVSTHKFLVQDEHYVVPELPETVKNLLAEPEQYVNDTIEHLDCVAMKEREKEECLMGDLEKAAKLRFRNAKAYTYGSRVSGLGAEGSDMDVFLDCGNMYNGNVTSKDHVSSSMKSLYECLSKDLQSWSLDELLTNCRTPIIRAHHLATGLACDISFENGLSVENTKLIKSFNEVFPPCRKMILFLKKWLTLCKLSGPDRISSYALYWYVIFYLQKESILPSIATLTRMNSRSHEIAGWEVGITREYGYNKAEANFDVKELLIRFFKFYADFDFRHDVVCPLLGDTMEKREFTDHRNLPKEMRPYVDYMKNSGDPEPLRIDSPMCIQDPLDLQHNITKAVSKVFLSRFRACCSKSIDALLCAP